MTTILFNKPFDVVTRFTAPQNAKAGQATLAAFIDDTSVWPVGRLDQDSEGLLVLTSDARLRGRLLDPSYAHERSYWAQVERVPTPEALLRLEQGVDLDHRFTRPAKACIVEKGGDLWERVPPIRHRLTVPTSWVELTLTEGRNRQVRRMTAAVGHPCLRLIRISIGPLQLFDLGLDPGEWRTTSESELRTLLALVK
jgi:23S rRNA pseudouridine2457 synthase